MEEQRHQQRLLVEDEGEFDELDAEGIDSEEDEEVDLFDKKNFKKIQAKHAEKRRKIEAKREAKKS